MGKRGCGILLHPTSLPGSEPIGTFGDAAFKFIDLLQKSGFSYWQMLPLNPPSCCNSPYSSFSAFAGNPYLIDLESIVAEGDLLKNNWQKNIQNQVDYEEVERYKNTVLHDAAKSFFATGKSSRMEEFWHFCDNTPWLHDYALFMALLTKFKGKPWWKWSKAFAHLTIEQYEKTSISCGEEIGVQKYIQWQFHRQWSRLKKYASTVGIELIGDIPIFVAHNSVDVWRNRELFLLDASGKPMVVAGVPPDYFSKTGQLWGNPLYDWDKLAQSGYGWWCERFGWMFKMFDMVRVDHFRGFEAAWHVPASDKNAVNGQWVKGHGNQLFQILKNKLDNLPIIAEDLGIITPEVEELRDNYSFPGMKILQFAFGSGAKNPYLPHNHIKNCVVYTGTHDNSTTAGWYADLNKDMRDALHDYLGDLSLNPVSGVLRTACMSVADAVIIPLQDILALDDSSRMNIPGKACGNWQWRVTDDELASISPQYWIKFLDKYDRVRKKSQY